MFHMFQIDLCEDKHQCHKKDSWEEVHSELKKVLISPRFAAQNHFFKTCFSDFLKSYAKALIHVPVWNLYFIPQGLDFESIFPQFLWLLLYANGLQM